MKIEDQKLHDEACERKEDHYPDSETGYRVLTAYFLKRRGYCCNSFCRHCPYGLEGKKESNRSEHEGTRNKDK